MSEGDIPQPVVKEGKFANPFPTWTGLPTFRDGWKLSREKNHSNVPNQRELNKTLPVFRPDLPKCPPVTGCKAAWLGHATVLVQIDGFTLLTDPIWSNRASPISFAGPLRYRPPPLALEDLPAPDIVVISHNHYDHLDKRTVKQLGSHFDDKDGHSIHWLVPAGMKSWMLSVGCKNVSEMSWGEEITVTSKTGAKAKVVFVPAQHWSMRNPLTGPFRSLWGGYAFIGTNHRFYFAGDTGYCSAFTEIGKKYGPFDLAAIPIGCYTPRWFMSPQHVDPVEAVKIHQDVHAKKSIGIHWGTYKMGSTEFYMEPRAALQQAVSEAGLSQHCFTAPDHGVVVDVD